MNVPKTGSRLIFLRHSLCTLTIGFGLGLTMVTSSCKDEVAKETNPPEEPAGPTSEDFAKLLNRKLALTKTLDRLLAKNPPADSAALKEARSENREAVRAFAQIQQDHPALKKTAKEISRWQEQYAVAKSSQRLEERDRAAKRLQDLHAEKIAAALKLPEVVKAQSRVKESELKVIEVRRNLASELPEAGPILKEIQEIEAELKATTKK